MARSDHENVFGMMMLAPVLTPHGLLTLRQAGEALALEPERGTRLEKAFMRGSGHGLLCLGADEVGTALPPVLSYCGNLGRAMWPRSAHFLVLPKVLPSSACPFPKKTNWTRSRRPCLKMPLHFHRLTRTKLSW